MRTTRRRFIAASALTVSALIAPAKSSVAQNRGPSGKILFVRSGNVWQWNNGETSSLFEDGVVSDPRWSPDGSEFLFVREGYSYSDLFSRSIADGSEYQLTFNQVVDYDPGSQEYAEYSIWVVDPYWSASGVIGYASDYYTPYGVLALWIMSYPGAAPSLYLSDPGDQSIEGVSLSVDGSVAAYTTRQISDETGEFLSFVAIQDLGTLESRALVWEPGGAFDPAIEPNGYRVAVVIRSGETSDIWLIDRESDERVQVTTGANAIKPCWSPDGNWLAYFQMVDFKFEARVVPVDGNTIGEAQQIFAFDDIDATSGLSWSLEA